MTDIQISTIREEKISLGNSHYVEVPLELYDEQDISYNSKKSKRFVFNKRIETAPKIKKFDIEDKTSTQLLSLYYSLPLNKKGFLLSQLSENSKKLSEMYLFSKDKEGFLKSIAKNTSRKSFIQIYKNLIPQEQRKFFVRTLRIAYGDLSLDENKQVNQILAQTFNKVFENFSKSDKKRFITNFSTTLKQLVQNTQKLSEKEKSELNQYVIELNKTSKNNKYFGDSFDTDIGNIMMILIRAFNDNMNTEGLDQISQINDTKLINKFLQEAQSILQRNLSNEQKIVNHLNKGTKGWAFWGVFALITVMVVIYVACPELLPEASDIAFGASETSDAVAIEDGVGSEVGGEVGENEAGGEVGENEVKNEGKEEENLGQENKQQSVNDGQKADKIKEEKQEDHVKNKEADNKKLEKQEEKQEDQQAQSAEETNKEEKKKEDNRPWYKKWLSGEKEVRIGRVKFKIGAHRIYKGLGIGIPAIIASYILMGQISSNLVPHPKGGGAPMSAKDSASLQTFQALANFENNVVNQNNNIQQTTAKRIGDDSERISQASGFVQQAINMFGQAYSFRA